MSAAPNSDRFEDVVRMLGIPPAKLQVLRAALHVKRGIRILQELDEEAEVGCKRATFVAEDIRDCDGFGDLESVAKEWVFDALAALLDRKGGDL